MLLLLVCKNTNISHSQHQDVKPQEDTGGCLSKSVACEQEGAVALDTQRWPCPLQHQPAQVRTRVEAVALSSVENVKIEERT